MKVKEALIPMKKTLTAAAAALLLLAGCSSAPQEDVDKIDEAVDEGDAAAETKLEGEAAYGDTGQTAKATVIKQGDKIADVIIETIDQDGNAITQLEDMADPKAQDSAIGTEYQEQVDYLENYIKENGVESIKTDGDGRVTDEEMLKNVDINVQPMLQAVQNALANEKDD